LNGPFYETTIDSERENCRPISVTRSPALRLPLIQQGINRRKLKQVINGAYDLVQINESNEIESLLLSKALKRKGVPTIIYQGMYEELSGRIQKIWQRCFRTYALPTLRKNTKIVLAKTDTANRFMRTKGFSRVVTLPVGLDHRMLDQGHSVNWRDELEIPSGAGVVLYVGKLEQRRNTWLMMRLAEAFSGGPLYFVFAGEGEDYGLAKEYAQKRDLQNIRFLGTVSQQYMRSLYQSATCLILASTYEIYGMVILEAMYYGVPVIASRTAGSEQIIHEGVDGVIVDGFELTNWVDALRQLVSDDEKRESIATLAMERIANELTWDSVASRYEIIVNELTNGC
jgi:glycosyltransferase involved in cell wall biosynthesis